MFRSKLYLIYISQTKIFVNILRNGQINTPEFIICSLFSFQNKLPNEINSTESEVNSNISSNNFWTDSETKALLFFLNDNFDLYQKNKQKFYAAAATSIGNNRTSTQVNSKIQSLKTRYKKENKEEIGKK
ncbi:hypothetical protein F8M41_023388 [Gigaspora margarita]|uniref:Myb/SANT-like DNA-binding domain-containing protein n=1 Tax=Gigaspora margarita TaxID=4874 RepID=A0A8H4ADF2_GIGMA|nr:hypothetical protein F8M41_023388 [Gigaspora margarita]